MSEVEHAEAVVSVPGIPEPIQKLPSDVMQVSDKMILLTWLAFGIAAFCLHKLLWKPILHAVEGREKSICDALEGAAKARKAQAESEDQGKKAVAQAEEEARGVEERATREAAAVIARADRDAKDVAKRRLEEAEQAIEAEQRKAFEALRRDSAAHFGDTIELFLRQKLTEDQKRAYQAEILNEVRL